MGSDPQYASYPELSLAQHIFHLTNPKATDETRKTSLELLQDAISRHKMAPLYRYLAHPGDGVLNAPGEGRAQRSADARPGQPSPAATVAATMMDVDRVSLPWDEKLYEQLQSENDKELETLEKAEVEAAESAGETEVQAAKGKVAEFWARVGDKVRPLHEPRRLVSSLEWASRTCSMLREYSVRTDLTYRRNQDRALAAYEAVFEKVGVLGTRIDLVLAMTRMGLFFGDKLLVKKNVERAQTLVDSGGDWDRRNRLKAYKGLHLLTVRSYSLAAPLLLDSLSTFTSYELCTYSSLVIYAVLAGSVALKRVDFKAKVVDAPEIRAILGDGEEKLSALIGTISAGPGADDADAEMTDTAAAAATATPAPAATAVNLTMLGQSAPGQAEVETPVDFGPLAQLVNSLYARNYQSFFVALAAVEESFLGQDRYLYEHRRWYVREMRLRGYQQMLQSYRVVGLASMAHDFGITVDYLDQ